MQTQSANHACTGDGHRDRSPSSRTISRSGGNLPADSGEPPGFSAGGSHARESRCFKAASVQEGIARMIRRAVQLHPNYSEAFANLGHLLRESGRARRSGGVLQAGDTTQSQTSRGVHQPWNAFYSLGKFEESANCHRQAIVASPPDFADAHTNLGNALYAMGRQEESVAAHRRAIVYPARFCRRI